jgi:dienelactone hydrolase
MAGLGLAVVCVTQTIAQTDAPAAPAEVLAKDLHEEVVRIPVTVSDMYGRQETRNMPITVYRPAGPGPYPLLVFNHGRAVTAKRAQQGRSRPEALARYFVGKGFVVLAPTRIGYWETYGDFDPEQTGGCSGMQVENMSAAASDQVLATVNFAKTLPYVDTGRWIVAGQSVGGLTTVATVARAPAGLVAGLNFAGGTGGDPQGRPGSPCRPQALEVHWSGIAKQAKVPMLWMYWQNDKYWGAQVPREWHKAWVGGGGQAEFVALAPSGDDGHNGLNADMDHWLAVVDGFLQRAGFTKPAIVARPPSTGFADIDNVGKVPVSARNRASYQTFLNLPLPRAFAVSSRGGWGSATGDYAVGRALGNCQRFDVDCKLYAVDNEVVWPGR